MAVKSLRLKLFVAVASVFLIYGLLYFYLSESTLESKENAKIPREEKKIDQAEKDLTSLNAEVLLLNFKQTVHNTDKFGFHNSNSIIVVVQVHSEIDYFRKLLESLKKVKNIEKVTLVLSLSNNENETNDLVSTIKFCRYLKIIFPYSMDFFPNSFPGHDPNDCSRDTPKHEAIASKCNNAYFPDSYGHYREVKFVQMKHHWLWKLHMVFRGIRVFKDLQQPVAMLEGNHYVLPDFLHCIEKAVLKKQDRCPTCGFIELGNFGTQQDYAVSDQLEIFSWTSTKSGLGFVLLPDFYRQLVEVTDAMCEFDDYNWSWSLQVALSNQLKDRSLILQFKSSRVFRLGSCHTMPTQSCTLNEEVEFIENLYRSRPLFPDELQVVSENKSPSISPRPNGGWGDIRDQVLCQKYKTLSETLLL